MEAVKDGCGTFQDARRTHMVASDGPPDQVVKFPTWVQLVSASELPA